MAKVGNETTLTRPRGDFFNDVVQQGIRISSPLLTGAVGASLTFGVRDGMLTAVLKEGDKETDLPARGSNNFGLPRLWTTLADGTQVRLREDLGGAHLDVTSPDKSGFNLTWGNDRGNAIDFERSVQGHPDEVHFKCTEGDDRYYLIARTPGAPHYDKFGPLHVEKGYDPQPPTSEQLMDAKNRAHALLQQDFPGLIVPGPHT